jgi:hypothetical protein
VLDGWFHPDHALYAPNSVLRLPTDVLLVDREEILTSTARTVGWQLGDTALKMWMAIATLHIACGRPQSGKVETSVGHIARLLWRGRPAGTSTERIITALLDLYRAELVIDGWDVVRNAPGPRLGFTRLLSNVSIDPLLLDHYKRRKAKQTGSAAAAELELPSRREVGRLFRDAGQGMVGWEVNSTYRAALDDVDLHRFEWEKAQRLTGVALPLWLMLTAPGMPYRPSLEAPDRWIVEIPLAGAEHYRRLGIHASRLPAQRRTLNQAAARICAVDSEFVAAQTAPCRHRGGDLLRITRTSPTSGAQDGQGPGSTVCEPKASRLRATEQIPFIVDV